ncbi:unnamed protein product [Gordionus sp. m RMFG-2023]
MNELKMVSGFFITKSERIGFCYISLVLTVLGMVGNILMFLSFNGSRKKSCGKERIKEAIVTQDSTSKYNKKIPVIVDFKEDKLGEDFKKNEKGIKVEESQRKNQQSDNSKTLKSSNLHYFLSILHIVSKIYTFARKIFNKNKGQATVTTLFAETLSVNNFLFCFTLIPWPLLYYWGAYNQSQFWRSKYYNLFMSNLEFPLRNVCLKISIGITLAMTVDRFIALKIPLRYKSLSTLKNCKISLIIITLVSIVTESRTILWYRTAYVHFIFMKNYLNYNSLLDQYFERWLLLNVSNTDLHIVQGNSSIPFEQASTQYINVYNGYFLDIVFQDKLPYILEILSDIISVIIPVLLITILSYFIVVAHRAYFINRKRMKKLSYAHKIINNNNSNINNNTFISKSPGNGIKLKLSGEESTATLIQITIVVQFLICEIPQLITHLAYKYFMCKSLNDLNCSFRDYLVLAHVLNLANHCLTFYIFMIFNENFRKLAKDIFVQ